MSQRSFAAAITICTLLLMACISALIMRPGGAPIPQPAATPGNTPLLSSFISRLSALGAPASFEATYHATPAPGGPARTVIVTVSGARQSVIVATGTLDPLWHGAPESTAYGIYATPVGMVLCSLAGTTRSCTSAKPFSPLLMNVPATQSSSQALTELATYWNPTTLQLELEHDRSLPAQTNPLEITTSSTQTGSLYADCINIHAAAVFSTHAMRTCLSAFGLPTVYSLPNATLTLASFQPTAPTLWLTPPAA